MKLIALSLLLAGCTRVVKCESPKITTVWIGHPMVSDNDPYEPSQAWIPGAKIGLRSDGVVVWKDVTVPR